MTHAVFIRLFVRQFGLSLAALCLMLQAAVPAGFMISPSESGFPLSIALCGAQGQTLSAADLGVDHDAPAPEDERPGQACAFAGLGAGFTAADAVRLPHGPARWTMAEFPRPAFRSPATPTATAPPPSRAPPSIV